MPEEPSLSELLDRFRAGDPNAAAAIYKRYEQRLIELADRGIGEHLQARVQPESIMLSVFGSLLRGIEQGSYTVDRSGSLWGLLRHITYNKINKAWELHTAQKRDIRRSPQGASDDPQPDPASPTPSPEDAAILAEVLDRIRSRLKPADFEIFQLQMEGLSNPEIAERLGCARQTIRYKAKRIEETLRRWADSDRSSQ